MYEHTDSDAHIKSRTRIMVNQAKYWAATYPELAALGLQITDDTAELVCTIFTEHLKTFHPLAAMVPLTSMYEHLIGSGQVDALGRGALEALAEMYIARGMATKILPHLDADDPQHARVLSLMQVHADYFGRAPDAPQVDGGKRGHSLKLYLQAHPELVQGKTLLHVAPEPQLTEYFEDAQAKADCVYRPVEGMRPGRMEHHDICELDIEDASIDTILCHHVLEHIVDDRKAFSELHRVLKPGGVLNFSIPQAFYLEETADWAIPDLSFHGHVRTYGRDLEQRFAIPGFELSREEWLFAQPLEVMQKARALYMLLYNARKAPV